MKPKYILAGIALALIILTILLPPVAIRLNHVGTRVRNFASNLFHAEERHEEIIRLQEQIALLEKKLLDYQYSQKEALLEKTKNDLGLKIEKRLIFSAVIGKGFFLGSQTLILNVGSNRGITGGEAVVVPPQDEKQEGLILVGRIANVLPYRSYVLLLTDASFEIPGKFADGSVKGKVKGGLGSHVTLEGVAQGLALQENKSIITDNDNPQIPAGILIGTSGKILSVATDPAQKASVRIFFDPSQLDVVGVIKATP